MKRKTYMVVAICFSIPIFMLTLFLDYIQSMVFTFTDIFILTAVFIFLTAYLLIVKKVIIYWQGMTEEIAEKIKNNPEDEKKVIKVSKIAGCIYCKLSL